MTDLVKFEFEDDRIRQAIVDGKQIISVYDIIRVIGGQKNPKEVWKRLAEPFPEVVTKCDYFKFPGRGQRLTPVCDRQTALEIIGLLPGAVGKKYREDAAQLFLQFLDFPEEIAKRAISRLKTETQVEEVQEALERRQKYIGSYHPLMAFMQELGAEGVHFAATNSANNDYVDIKGSRTGNTSPRQEKELTVLQIMQQLSLEDKQAEIMMSKDPGWEAADTTIVQGAKTLAHIRGITPEEALEKVQLPPKAPWWKRGKLERQLKAETTKKRISGYFDLE